MTSDHPVSFPKCWELDIQKRSRL